MKLKHACLIVFLAVWLALPPAAEAQDTIKVGVLHSLSGSMAISETTLKDTILMMVDAQNEKGGLLGRQLEAIVVDPASDWPLFAEMARSLLESERVDVVFGWLDLRVEEIGTPGVRREQRTPLLSGPVRR